MTTLRLREVAESDLPIFFEQHRDAEARHMAAFAPPDPDDRDGFIAYWQGLRHDEDIIMRTVEADGEVAGNMVCFRMEGDLLVGYWLGRAFWGRGIATSALSQLLALIEERPVYARVVKDNIGSLRVLEKCGFAIVDEGSGFAHGRGEVVEEWILALGE